MLRCLALFMPLIAFVGWISVAPLGFASTGPETMRLVPGVTTEAEVARVFGPPRGTYAVAGAVYWTYSGRASDLLVMADPRAASERALAKSDLPVSVGSVSLLSFDPRTQLLTSAYLAHEEGSRPTPRAD